MSSQRQILLNPGPVTLSERVRTALGRGDWCHREPEFAALIQEINARLVAVYPALAGGFQAATLCASGTGAVEAMLAAFAPEDATTLVAANGVYGERMVRMLAAHGRPHQALQHGWTDAVDLGAIEAAFTGRGPWKRRLPQIVEALAALGRTREMNGLWTVG